MDLERGEIDSLEDLRKSLVLQEDKSVVFEEDESHENSGSTKMLLISICVAVCGAFEFGSCVGYSAPAEFGIRKDLNLSVIEYSIFGSVVTIGAMLGAITSGQVADLLGRKGAMRMSAGFCIAGWLAVFFAGGALPLDIGRLFTGYGIGIFSFVVPVYIAEIAPKNLRGGLTALNEVMILTGSSAALLTGTVLTWKALALTGLLPCIFLLTGLCFIPESPRWLVKVGLQKEFQAALQKLRGEEADISFEAAEIHASVGIVQNLSKAGIVDLFQRKYIRSMVIGVLLMAFQQLVGINGILFYVNETFVSAGLSSANIGTMAFACVQVPMTIIGAFLVDRLGRRPILMLSATGTFLGCLLAGVSFCLKERGLLLDWMPSSVVCGLLIFISGYSLGMGAVPWVMMSEIFPINIKGAAGSLVVLVNWFGAWLVSFTYKFLMNWSSSGTYFLFAAFSAMTVIFVAKFVPETKGKTLEDVQACFNS